MFACIQRVSRARLRADEGVAHCFEREGAVDAVRYPLVGGVTAAAEIFKHPQGCLLIVAPGNT